jgi:hypothetical protein
MSESQIDAIIGHESIARLADWLEARGSEVRHSLGGTEQPPILGDPLAAAHELIAATPAKIDESIRASLPKLDYGRESIPDVAALRKRLGRRPAVECVLGMIPVDGRFEITLFNRQLRYVSIVTCMIPEAMLEEVVFGVFALNLAARVAYNRRDAAEFDLRKPSVPKIQSPTNDGMAGQSILTEDEIDSIITSADRKTLKTHSAIVEMKKEKYISYRVTSYKEFLANPPNKLLVQDLCHFSDIIDVQIEEEAEIVWTAYDCYAAIFQQIRIGNWATDAQKLNRLEFAFWLQRQKYVVNTGELPGVDLIALTKKAFANIEEKF